MKPHDSDHYGRQWDFGYCAALAPKRRPPAKRGHRQRMRDRTRRLQRALKFSALEKTR